MANAVSDSQGLPVDVRTLRTLLKLDEADRKRLGAALQECNNAVQQAVERMIDVIEDPKSTPEQRSHAASAIRAALDPEAGEVLEPMDSQQAAFAERLRGLLNTKAITQAELASRVGCSQPAISQLLNRISRPQRQTIIKLAQALRVHPRELWPDLEVAELLDAAAAVQDDGMMSEHEADAFRRALERPVPATPAAPLPRRKR